MLHSHRDGVRVAPALECLRREEGAEGSVPDYAEQLLGGAQVTATPRDTRSLGYVTSAVYSPALGEHVGLALVARDHAAPGAEVVARDPLRGGDTPLRIVPCTHVDREGTRLKA